MNRRKAIKNTGMFMLSLAILPSLFTACKNKSSRGIGMDFDADKTNVLDELSDTMLPSTSDSPGAKIAGTGKVINQIINNCYTPEEKEGINNLLVQINRSSIEQFDKDFVELDYQDRLKILTPFDEAKEELYVKLKELTVHVYFTSEIGMNKALRYHEVPGSYNGCLDYNKGDKAFAWSL